MISAIAIAFGLAAAGMLATPYAPPQQQQGSWGTVSGASSLNLRTCAGTKCARIAAMPFGARVFIDGATAGWYHVSYSGVPGYASAHYISTAALPLPSRRTYTPPPAPAGGSAGAAPPSAGPGYGY